MNRFPGSLSIQSEGCRALQNLAVGTRDNRVREGIASAGGIEAIVTAMNGFPNDASIQCNATGALQNLACNSEDIKCRIARCGGIHVLISAMQNHPDRPLIQVWACGTLAYLAASPDERIKKAIVLLGGLVVIVKAAQLNCGDKVLTRMAGKVMSVLLRSTEQDCVPRPTVH